MRSRTVLHTTLDLCHRSNDERNYYSQHISNCRRITYDPGAKADPGASGECRVCHSYSLMDIKISLDNLSEFVFELSNSCLDMGIERRLLKTCTRTTFTTCQYTNRGDLDS